MNRKRLEKIAAFLETRPTKHFDMEQWGTKNTCGYVVCAIGDALLNGVFNDDPYIGFDERESPLRPGVMCLTPIYYPYPTTPIIGIAGMEGFFDLNHNTFCEIFTNDGYEHLKEEDEGREIYRVHAKDVAAKIRDLLNTP